MRGILVFVYIVGSLCIILKEYPWMIRGLYLIDKPSLIFFLLLLLFFAITIIILFSWYHALIISIDLINGFRKRKRNSNKYIMKD